MKSIGKSWLGIASLLAAFSVCAVETSDPDSAAVAKKKAEAKANMETVCRFLKDSKVYFLATVDGDQPRVRPFGTVNIFEGRLYIQTGRKKDVSKQIARNGKVELCAYQPETKRWLRLSGTLVDDDRREAKQSMLDAYPGLRKMYSPDDPNTQVLYFAPGATATIDSFPARRIVLNF